MGNPILKLFFLYGYGFANFFLSYYFFKKFFQKCREFSGKNSGAKIFKKSMFGAKLWPEMSVFGHFRECRFFLFLVWWEIFGHV